MVQRVVLLASFPSVGIQASRPRASLNHTDAAPNADLHKNQARPKKSRRATHSS